MEFSKLASQRQERVKCIKIEKTENWKEIDKRDEIEGSSLSQFISTIGVYILTLNTGVINAWSSPALPYLKSHNSPFRVTDFEGAWIAALPSLGFIIGSITFPIFIDRIGRKYTILLFAIFQAISGILFIIGQNYIYVYISRVIVGIGGGGAMNATVIYLGEIVEKKVRGMAMAFMHISRHLGILIVAILGAYSSYNTMNWALLSIPIGFLVFFFLMPETPYFYLMQEKDAKAIKTLMKLRGLNNPEAVMKDIQSIKKSIAESKESERNIWKEMFSDNICRNNIIVVVLATATIVYSGFIVITAYAQEILSESGSSLDPKNAVMILATIDVVTIIPSSQIIDHFGRRILFFTTGILTAMSLGIIGLYFFLKFNLKSDVSSITWLPLVGLILFHCSCNLGFTIIPLIYMSEIFPIRVKGPATAFVNLCGGIFGFTAKLLFQTLRTAGGICVPFWTFGTCCVIGTYAVFLLAPETKGKNLEEIQEMLQRKKSGCKLQNILED